MKFGRGIREENDFLKEVEFSKKAGFDFMQVWYYKGDIIINSNGKDKTDLIKEIGFPIIIHAVLTVEEIEVYLHNIIEVLQSLSHKELIIHPVCDEENISGETIHSLRNSLDMASSELKKHGINLLVENNCRKTKLNYSVDDIKLIYTDNEEIELLLDIAHVDSYNHLEQILEIREPKMLHIADKHFTVEHEHLPIGNGELDFEKIFSEYLKEFTGKIILEIYDTDEEIEDSLRKIQGIVS
ncbi:MAG: sugar phosphate isomerase/epimerase [Clostridiales bacterium]|nr:sugar phosphate isomerase/epimerase [Clostridiales bacterium]